MTTMRLDNAKSPPNSGDSLDDAIANSQDQIEAMTGMSDIPVRLRLIDQRHDVRREKRRHAIQLCGSLANEDFCHKLWEFNRDGYDVYVVAQAVNSHLPKDAAVSIGDIESGQVIVADFDNQDFLEKWVWHLPPSFFLRRENSDRHFWLGWQTEPYSPTKIRDIHQRIIHWYGSDPAVCDPARIIRLAGFYSHKREQKTRYIFERGPGWLRSTGLKSHLAKLPKVYRNSVSAGDWDSDDYVSEKRLLFLLKQINPGCDRQKWIGVLGAIKDAKIGRDDFTYMEPFDKYELADKWSSGELSGSKPENYRDSEDIAYTLNTLCRGESEGRATVGSLVCAAKEAGMDEVVHKQMRSAELFTHPDNASNSRVRESKPELKDVCPKHFSMQSFDQLLAKEPQPVTEIIPDRIEQGVVNFLSGPGGSHKSRLALQYCVCIGARKPVFGKTPMEVMPIYVSAEDGEDEIIRRMHKLAKQLGVHPDDVRETTGYLDRTNQDNALVRMHEKGGYTLTPFQTQLGNYVAGLPGHKFLVLDSCYDFVRFEGNSKVNEDAVNIFVKEVLGGFCQDTNSTLLIPWHPSYSGQVRGDGSGWSVAWHNSPRVRDQIRRNASGDAFELTAEKRNHGALPEPITLHYSDGALLPKAEIELSEQRATDRDAVKKMAVQMAKRGLPIQRQRKISKTELDLLQEKFDCQLRNKEVKDILNRAVVDGELQYVRGSKYQSAGYYPSDAGQELARDAKERQKPRKN